MEIEKDEIFALAEQYIESTGTSVFLTGKAGTGKTTFLRHITSTTSKRFVVLAPTGVAAINAGGSTIHSFFQLPLCPYLPDVKELVTEYHMDEKYRSLRKERVKIIRSLDLIIIDEISMVRADILDAVDSALRRYRRSDRPFGGVQLLMIGDAQQLSPVVKDSERQYIAQVYPSPYFFSAKSLQRLPYVTIELQKVHRQKDGAFLDILNAVRENRVTRQLLDRLNSRVGAEIGKDGETEPIRLTTHNRQADEVNSSRMEALPGGYVTFGAVVEGEFPENSYPVDEVLKLKKGAQVMFVRNDPEGEYYNGKIGTVEAIAPDGIVTVTDRDGLKTAVSPVEWENVQYELDKDSGEIRQIVAGTFKQIPLRPAWAITIHKSQGLTFDKVVIDAGSAFAFGQVYVALSRCRSLEGIRLETPVSQGVIYSDRNVAQFNDAIVPMEEVAGQLEREQKRYCFDTMRQVFDFEAMCKAMRGVVRAWKGGLGRLYGTELKELEEWSSRLHQAADVAQSFRRQLSQLEAKMEADDPHVAERLVKAAGYFLPDLEKTFLFCTGLGELEIDNKEIKKQVREPLEEFLVQADICCQTLETIQKEGFSVGGYGRIRTASVVEDSRKARSRRLRKAAAAEGPAPSVNEKLRDRLIEWRKEQFKAENIPAYHVMLQSTLLEIAARIPKTESELMKINGIGEVKCKKYGAAILEICKEF